MDFWIDLLLIQREPYLVVWAVVYGFVVLVPLGLRYRMSCDSTL